MRPLLAVILLTRSIAPPTPETPSPLDEGLRLYHEGALDRAVLAFDDAIGAIPPSTPATPSLVKAYVYKGAALVGLGQEGPAKASFREALARDSKLRLSKTEFPDRVVRVFDAARSGKTKSVMARPSEAPKKAGIGALGVAGIVGGALLAGGAAVAVAAASSGERTASFPEGFSVSFVSSTPPPGSTIRVGSGSGQRVVPVTMTFSLRAGAAAVGQFRADLFKGDRDCAIGHEVPYSVTAGSTTTITVQSATFVPDPACALPVTTNRMAIQLLGTTFSAAIEGVSYTLVE